MDKRTVVAAVIVFIIIVIGVLIWNQWRFVDTFLEGMWTSDEAFERASDIDKMYLYIGDKERSARLAHLVIIVDDEVVTSKQLRIKQSLPNVIELFKGRLVTSVKLECEEKDPDISLFDFMPRDLKLSVDIVSGKLILHKKKQYAVLYKNNISTAKGKDF